MDIRILVLAALALSNLSNAATPCLHYNDDSVELIGTVRLQTFFGPPNYGEDPKTDARETQTVLVLDHPICVSDDPKNQQSAEQDQQQITLVPLGRQQLSSYAGQRITVQGALFHAMNGHHHTAVLLQLEHLKPAQP